MLSRHPRPPPRASRSLAAIAEMQVSGILKFGDSAAYLRLAPTNISSSSQSSAPESASSPNKHADVAVLDAITCGKVMVHPTRQPLTPQELQTSMEQRPANQRGATGGWNVMPTASSCLSWLPQRGSIQSRGQGPSGMPVRFWPSKIPKTTSTDGCEY